MRPAPPPTCMAALVFANFSSDDVGPSQKPQNILLDEHMRPKICDFGLSKTREHTLTHQGIHGTAPYMVHTHPHRGARGVPDLAQLLRVFVGGVQAPELLDSDEAGRYGGKSDERVDVYSFAIVYAPPRPSLSFFALDHFDGFPFRVWAGCGSCSRAGSRGTVRRCRSWSTRSSPASGPDPYPRCSSLIFLSSAPLLFFVNADVTLSLSRARNAPTRSRR
jgi:serine/threonine protein kinase